MMPHMQHLTLSHQLYQMVANLTSEPPQEITGQCDIWRNTSIFLLENYKKSEGENMYFRLTQVDIQDKMEDTWLMHQV